MTEKRHFMDLLLSQWIRGNFVCVGLDSEYGKIPKCVPGTNFRPIVTAFNQRLVEATNHLACAYKPNLAFYLAHGAEGVEALRQTIADIHAIAPTVPVILDAKFADIGNTNIGYAEFAFDYLQADALTVNPYLGAEALQPFLTRTDKGIIILCCTSNSGAGEFQNLSLNSTPLYQTVALRVAEQWNKNGNCGLVVGATYPSKLYAVRQLVGDLPILIPGIGAQGGEVKATIMAGRDSQSTGIIINASRSIIFASLDENFATAAGEEITRLHTLITQYRFSEPTNTNEC